MRTARPPPLSVTSLPGAGSPTSHIFDLLFGYSLDSKRLGVDPDSTPLSIMGPGASGSIVALNNIPNLQRTYRMTLGLLQEGTAGLFRKPLSPKAESIEALHGEICMTQTMGLIQAATERYGNNDDDNNNADDDTNNVGEVLYKEKDERDRVKPSAAWKAVAYSTFHCVFCGEYTDFLSPAHVLVYCQEPSVVRTRYLATSSLPIMIKTIVANAIYARRSGMENGGLYDVEKRIHELLDDYEWCTPDGRYVLFRMLMAAPWPADAVRDTPSAILCELARLLGKVFDLTNARHFKIRRLVNRWVAWASKHASNIAKAWAAAIDKRYESVVIPRVQMSRTNNDSEKIDDNDGESEASEYSMMDYSAISDDSDTSTRHDADSDYVDTDSGYDDSNDRRRKGTRPHKDHRGEGQKGIKRMVDARQRVGTLSNINGPILSSLTPPKEERVYISYDMRYSILMAAVERLPRRVAIETLNDSTLLRVLLHEKGK